MTNFSCASATTNTPSACNHSGLHSPLAGTSTGLYGLASELIQVSEGSELQFPLPISG